jgi:hypothetical protein
MTRATYTPAHSPATPLPIDAATRTGAAPRPETLRDLLGRLRPYRVRELAVIGIAALAIAFAVGHQTATLAARPDIAALEAERAALQGEVAQLPALAAKEEFVSLTMRYWLARRAYFALASEGNRTTMHLSRAVAVRHIEGMVARGEAQHRAGADGAAELVLAADGSVWPLPGELAIAY